MAEWKELQQTQLLASPQAFLSLFCLKHFKTPGLCNNSSLSSGLQPTDTSQRFAEQISIRMTET